MILVIKSDMQSAVCLRAYIQNAYSIVLFDEHFVSGREFQARKNAVDATTTSVAVVVVVAVVAGY